MTQPAPNPGARPAPLPSPSLLLAREDAAVKAAEAATVDPEPFSRVTPVEASPEVEAIEAPKEDPKAAKKAELEKIAKAESAKWREKRSLAEQKRQLAEREVARQAEFQRMREEVARAKSDPLSYIEQNGVTADTIAQRIIKRGSAQGQLEELAKQQAELRAMLTERDKMDAQRTYETTKQQAEDEFASVVSSNEENYPALSVLPRKELLAKAHEAAQNIVLRNQRKGVVNKRITPRELADELERLEAPKFAKFQEKVAKKSASTNQGTEEKLGSPAKSNGTGPRTLTNGLSSERGTKPIPFDRLPEKEQNRLLAEEFRKATGRG